jgi:hypothetical protein
MEENWKTFIEDQRRMASTTLTTYTISDNLDKVGGGIEKREIVLKFGNQKKYLRVYYQF